MRHPPPKHRGLFASRHAAAIHAFVAFLAFLFMIGMAHADVLTDIRKGIAAYRAGTVTVAIDYFTKAINSGELSNTGLSEVLNARGAAHAQLGDDASAIEDYTLAISIDRQNALAYANRGVAYVKTNEIEKALADYDTALLLTPKDADTLNNRCWARSQAGDHQTAKKDCLAALSLAPTNADILHSLAYVEEKLKNRAQAVKYYCRAVRYRPDFKEALQELSRLNAQCL